MWMAWRQISSAKGRSLSFMTKISIFGITIGVAALVIVLSVMGGFEEDLKKKMFRGLPHLEILNKEALLGFSLQNFSLNKAKKLFPTALGVEPFTQADVVLKNGKNLASVTLFGISPEHGGKLWGFYDSMIQGSIDSLRKSSKELESRLSQAPRIVLGESLAVQLNADVGDLIQILNPQANLGNAFEGREPLQSYLVSGVFLTDLPQFDSKYAVVNLTEGRKFIVDFDQSLEDEKYVSGIAINLKVPEDVDLYIKNISRFPDLAVLTWKEVNKSLLVALKLEKFTMGAILLLIVLVAAFSISGTLTMTVYHKKSHIALLRSLGMSEKDISKLFLINGFIIGSVGVFIGLSLGLMICFAIYNFQFIDLPAGVYYQNKLPVKFLSWEYLAIAAAAWFMSLVAALYPAFMAAKQDPGKGLRCL